MTLGRIFFSICCTFINHIVAYAIWPRNWLSLNNQLIKSVLQWNRGADWRKKNCNIQGEIKSGHVHAMRRMLAFVVTGDHDAAHTRVHYNRFSPSPCTCLTGLWHSWTQVRPDKSAALTAVLTKKKAPWSESASELYRPSDRRLSAKWLPTFADRGCHVDSVTDPYGRILDFLDRSRYFSIK
jgi:hypothetical protein